MTHIVCNKSRQGLGCLLTILLACPLSAQAETFWTESFDDGEAAVESRWAASCGINWLQSGVFSLDTSQRVSGTASMKEVVDGLTTRVPEFLGGECFIDRSGFSTDTFFIRWYERTDAAFEYDPNNTKTINIGDEMVYPSWWFLHGQNAPILHLVLGGQGIDDGGLFDAPTYEHNMQAFNTPTNQWVCVEAQIVMNTPGVANGVLRLWQNGTLLTEYLDQIFRSPVNTPVCPGCSDNSPNAQFNLVRIYAQHGVGTRWFDEIALGDTRIGCDADPVAPPVILFIEWVPVVVTMLWHLRRSILALCLAGMSLIAVTAGKAKWLTYHTTVSTLHVVVKSLAVIKKGRGL